MRSVSAYIILICFSTLEVNRFYIAELPFVIFRTAVLWRVIYLHVSFFLNSCSENGALYSNTHSYIIVQCYEMLMYLKGSFLPLWIMLVFSVPSLRSYSSCLTVLPIFSKCAGQATAKKTKGYLWTSMSFSSHMIANSSFSVWAASSQNQMCGYVWS